MADVIVIGLGAMGSAAAANLAARGHRVRAFDRFTPPHAHGSSHGHSRIFRQAYWEDIRYVPLLFRARELWHVLERDSGKQLLHVTGGLMISPPNGQLAHRSAESARQFDLPHQVLSARELMQRWPVFRVDGDHIALFEHNAGYLVPELCIEQQLAQAAHSGAELHFNEPVLDWTASPSGTVAVRTERGNYESGHLVITTGPWAPQTLADLVLPLRVTRQSVFWFEPPEPIEQFRSLPIYLFESSDSAPVLYGFPLIGPSAEGVKAAFHGSTEFCTPESVRREIRPEEELSMRARLANTLPSLAGRLLRAETCLYTMTPDENFILGAHPLHPSVFLAAGFSGHGFKFALVIGEVLADLVTDRRPSFDISMFSPSRFAPA